MNKEFMDYLSARHHLEPLLPTVKGASADIKGLQDGNLHVSTNQSSIEPFKIDVSPHGQLLQQGKPLSTDDYGIVGYRREAEEKKERKEYKIMVHQDGGLYGVPEESNSVKYKHSSLVANEWPLIAGTLETNKHGYITELTNRSGHFVPAPSAQNALIEYMQQRGANLNELHPNNHKYILNEAKTAKKLDGRGGRVKNCPTPSHYKHNTQVNAGALSNPQTHLTHAQGAAAAQNNNNQKTGKSKSRGHSF